MLPFSIICLFLYISSVFAGKKFPDSFQFGTAGASYQLEGGWNEDGKGVNMWDTFTHVPGHILNNDTGDVACDSYHKYKEDVQILKDLGVKLYRFSISWARIFPDGTPNKINQPGIDYYLNLLKELKANDIEPLVTLYHWDLPQHLTDLGGWLNPEIADYFAAYARVAFEKFGPYVKYWLTLNEPISTCTHGYEQGTHAPGLTLNGTGIYQCAYVSLLAHAKAYRIYDEEFRAKQGGQITINVVTLWYYAKTNSTLDLIAQERALEHNLGLFANPVFKGNWPQIVIDRVANRSILEGFPFSRLPEFTNEEIDLINGTFDYFAINIYTSRIAEYDSASDLFGTPSFTTDIGAILTVDPSWPTSASSRFLDEPLGARYLLQYIQEKYNPPAVMITENGIPDHGDLNDSGRIAYYKGYLTSILNAIEDGVNVTGYTLWSILDNFEWAEGYSLKFGIVQVDFNSPNRTRTYKDSAEWYKRVVAAREIVD